VLLLLRRQLNLSDTLNTAQLRLLYGTNGANPGDKRRVRVLQLLKEVEQKIGGSHAPTDGLSVEQLLKRAVQVAARVQQTNNAATLEKWKPAISAAVPCDTRQLEPENPWKEHVMQQEMTRHVNQWSGTANGADGGGGVVSAVLHVPKEDPLPEKRDASAKATENQQQETDSTEKSADESKTSTLVAVDEAASTVKNAALPSSDELVMSAETKPTLKQQGRVSAWRCKDAAQDVIDEAQVPSSIDTCAIAQSAPKNSSKEEKIPAKSSRRTPRPVSSRLYPGPASPSPHSSSGTTGKSPKPRMFKRRSSDAVNGNASLGSLSMVSINSPRANVFHSTSTRKKNQHLSGPQHGASKLKGACPKSVHRQKLSKLEQTLAELAAEADELLHA
jgi:hypothetical protein